MLIWGFFVNALLSANDFSKRRQLNNYSNFTDNFEGVRPNLELAQMLRLKMVRSIFPQAIPQATKRHHAATDPYLPSTTITSS